MVLEKCTSVRNKTKKSTLIAPRVDGCPGFIQDCHVLCHHLTLCSWVALTQPELVPWNAVQDLVPTVHRQPRQQASLVSLTSQQHCQRHKLCRWRAPRVRDRGPIT